MLFSSGISLACFIVYKTVQRCYTKYYLTSECHQRSIEIFVVDVEEEKQKKERSLEKENKEIELKEKEQKETI